MLLSVPAQVGRTSPRVRGMGRRPHTIADGRSCFSTWHRDRAVHVFARRRCHISHMFRNPVFLRSFSHVHCSVTRGTADDHSEVKEGFMTASPLAQTPNDMFKRAHRRSGSGNRRKSSTPNCPGSKNGLENDRIREFRASRRPTGTRLRADQQIRRRLSGTPLLRRLRAGGQKSKPSPANAPKAYSAPNTPTYSRTPAHRPMQPSTRRSSNPATRSSASPSTTAATSPMA